ncbi:MAG: heme ABC exporter ATP-binding protein CcmA, partial [Nitratireductor sp.]|nr:heme ABC exporter ATP-binding protein CcmA [Nitratireductor sp.]
MLLTARGLACQRAGRVVFRDLDFSVGAGEAMALRGRNGAGKTSLLRVIAGLVPAAAGSLDLQGGEADASIGEQCHFVGPMSAIKPVLTVRENLDFWRRFQGGSGSVSEALDRVGIGNLAGLPARYLSAGQQRRLALAVLVATRRPVWLLDEPLNALDADGAAMLNDLMRAHLGDGGIVIAATHADIDAGTRTLH